MKNLLGFLGPGAVGAVLAWTGAARAETCPVTHDATHSDLHLYNYTPTAGVKPRFLIGNFNFYGSSVIGACVQDQLTGAGTLYVMVDQDNHILGWLPATYSSFCLTNDDDEMFVLTANESQCGTTMTPLNYNGNDLIVSGLDGVDHIDGGNGYEVLHGGASTDNLSDDSVRAGNNPIYGASMYGEAGNDVMFGSAANNTYSFGGIGNDAMSDEGGTGDVLIGNDGNECCMFDSNEGGALWCEAGTDTVNILAGSHNCEVQSTQCTVNVRVCVP